MRKSMQKLAMACIAAYAVLGGIQVANAQMHGGSHEGSGGYHAGNGSHHGGGSHHDGGFHGRRAPPVIFAPGYYPYGYVYPYGYDSSSIYWYCGDPAGYYPDVQVCASGWMQVVPNS